MTAKKDFTTAQAIDLLKQNILENDPRIGVEIVTALDILRGDLDSYKGYSGHSGDLGLVYFNKQELEMRAGLVEGPLRVERPLNEGRVNTTNPTRQV